MNEEYLKGLTKEELIEIIYNETTCTYQLKNNWNELKKYVREELKDAEDDFVQEDFIKVLDRMQELEQWKDE